MSQTAITLVFEQWKAQQAATGEPVLLDEFIFALVPGLDPSLPVERNETLPAAAQIVHRESVTRKGVINENAVVHSAVLGANVGDFSFNWIGLTNKATGTLAMIVHAPEQQKLRTKAGQQGNVLTRSFLMEFTGAQAETAINTPAETWQIDFTARLAGIDERQRLENIDLYGVAAFFGDGWLVGKTDIQFVVTKGTGYVAGLRAELATDQNITVTTKPVKVWLDVCWTGTLNSVRGVLSKITMADSLKDYDQGGVKHYVFALASIAENGLITDLRPKGNNSDRSSERLYMRKDHNLSDMSDAIKARRNLSVYSRSEVNDKIKVAADAAERADKNAESRISKSGDTVSGTLISGAQEALRIKQAKQSIIFRFDGSNFYLLKTKANDPDGPWDDSRPFSVNADSGAVTFGNGFTTNANIRITWGGVGHVYQENGDIVETAGAASIFRGFWSATNLSGALTNITDRANDAWNKADDAQNNRVTADWVWANYLPRGHDQNTVGTFVLAWSNTGNVDYGTVVSGSNLFPSTADGARVGWSLPGSWRCAGAMRTINDAHRVTLWQRLA